MKKSQVIVDGAVQQCKDEATIQVSVGSNCLNIFTVCEYTISLAQLLAWESCAIVVAMKVC